jgi:hypothetical protein
MSYRAAPKDANVMRTVVWPAVAGVIALAVVVVLFEIAPYVYRFVRNRAPKGTWRTLQGIGPDAIEGALRGLAPLGTVSIYVELPTPETLHFANELEWSLQRSGWNTDTGSGWTPVRDRLVRDIEIHVPDVNNAAGPIALSKRLNGWGYTANIVQSDEPSRTFVIVGERRQ